MDKPLQLLDVVALLTDLPDEKLRIGQAGSIVEELTDDVFEVEFADAKGRILTICAVEIKDLIKLTHDWQLNTYFYTLLWQPDAVKTLIQQQINLLQNPVGKQSNISINYLLDSSKPTLPYYF